MISRFLLCKHLVRLANEKLSNAPIGNLRFFLGMQRHHIPPYYVIPGIHTCEMTDHGCIAFDRTKTLTLTSLLLKNNSKEIGHDAWTMDAIGRDDGGKEKEKKTVDRFSPFCSDDDEPERVSVILFSCAELIDVTVLASQEFFSAAQMIHARNCLEDMEKIALQPQGVHQKLSRMLKRTLADMDAISQAYNQDNKRRSPSRTYKDGTAITMYLD